MVRLPILLLAAALGPALGAQAALTPVPGPLTIEQFEKSSLPVLHAMHDKQAARELAGLKLAERASPEGTARWQAQMPGKLSQEALTALVDAAAFLEPPAEETPSTPPPAMDAQRQMLKQAVDQVQATLHKLPNFYAKRTTAHFETATPELLDEQQQTLALHQLNTTAPMPLTPLKPFRLPHQELGPIDRAKPRLGRLFFITDEAQTVTYSNGEEVASTAAEGDRGWRGADLGLATSGEFGPILEMVLRDALQHGLRWSHWEQGASGMLAVFHYEVSKDLSHYEIVSWEGKPSYFPAYHGELAIDPATGAILRITVESAGAEQPDQLLDSAILVEYAAVAIGGQTYNCPVHSVAISRTREPGEARDASDAAEEPTFLNDATFTGYHLFRGEVRILPAAQ
jgi:hypothetical protein